MCTVGVYTYIYIYIYIMYMFIYDVYGGLQAARDYKFATKCICETNVVWVMVLIGDLASSYKTLRF